MIGFLFLTQDLLYGASLSAALPQTMAYKIPASLGRIESSYRGTSDKTIVFVQDAHDSIQAQMNIARIIRHAVTQHGVKTVFEEGYEGMVPTDEVYKSLTEPRTREAVSYYLLDHLRIGGAEFAHINRFNAVTRHPSLVARKKDNSPRITSDERQDFALIGADSLKGHFENVRWFRRAVKEKAPALQDIDWLSAEFQRLADGKFSKPAKTYLKLKQSFDSEQIDLPHYLQRARPLASKEASYPCIDLLLKADQVNRPAMREQIKNMAVQVLFEELQRMDHDIVNRLISNVMPSENLSLRGGAREPDEAISKVYLSLQHLSRIKRLLDFKMTPAELAAVKNDMLTFDTAAMARLLVQETKRSAVFSKTWEVAVQDAIQFYEAALKREIAAETQLNLFLNQSSEKIAVLVYGGFHRQGIENVLARKGFSYYVISPKISNIEIRDQTRYRKLMAEGYEIDPLHAEREKGKGEREMTKTEKLENVQAARVISELELVHRGGATALRSLQRYHLNLNGIASQVLERTAESVQPREYVSAQIDRRLREQLIGVRSEVRNTAEDRQKFIELLHLLNRNWWLINDGQALDKFFLEFQEHHPNEDAVRGWDDEKFLDRKRGAAEMISHRLAAGKLRAMVLSYPEDEAHLFQLLAQLKMPLRTDDFDLWQNTQDVEVQRLRRALDPAQHLARQGYEVHIVTSHDPTLNHSNTFIYEEAAAAAKHLMRWMTRHPSDLEVEQKTYLFSEMTDPLYELVFNLIEYGESGVLGFKRTRSEEGDFFEAVVWDNGPGLLDPQTALTASLGRLGANGAGFRQLNYFPGTVTIESHDKKWVKQGSEPLFIPAGPGSVKSGSGTKITLRIGINLEGARYAHAEAREAGLVESGVRQSGKRSEVRASSSSQFRVYLIDYILSDIDHKKTANKIINLFLSSSTSLRDEIKDRLQNLLNNQKEGAALRDLGLGALLQQTSAGQRARIRVLYERLFDSTGAAHKQIPLLDESKSSLPQTTKASVSAESNVLIIKMGKRKERLALETLQQPLKQEDEARLRAIYTPYNVAVALEQMRNGQFSWNDSIFQVVRNEQGVLIAYGWAYLNPKTKVLGLASVGVDKAYRKKGIAAWLRIGQMDQGVSRGMTSVRAHVGTEGRRNGWHWSLKKLGFDFESFSFSDMDVMFQNAADQALRDVKTQTTGLNEEQQKEAVEKVLNRFPAASLVMGMRLTYGSVARFKEVVRNRTKRSEVRTSFDESKRGQVFVLLIGTRTAMQPFKDYLIAQGYHPENVDIVSPRSKKELPRPEKIYHAKVKLGELPDTAFETLLKSLEFNLPWTYREFVSRGSDAETYWNKKDLLERQRQALNAREQQLRERALEIERELPLRQAAVARAKAHADKVRVWANKVRERIHNSVFWLIFYTIALALKDKGAFRISAASIITFYGLIVSVKLFFHFWGHPYGLIWSALATAVVAGVFGDFAYTVLSGFTKSRNEEAEDAAKENSEKNKSDFLGYLVQYGGAALFAPPFILAANFFWGSGIWANVKLGAGTFFSYRLHWILGALLAVDLIIHLFKRHNNEHDSSDSETRLLNAATATLVAPVGEEFWFRWAWFNLSQWWWVGWVVFSHPFNFQLPFIGVSVGFGLPLGVFIAMMANADLFFKAHGTRKWFHHWFMGAVASYVYYESHSLIVPITIHFLWNLTSSIYQLALHRYLPLRPSSLDFETLEALTSRPVGESSDQPRSEVRSLRKENLEAPGPRNRDAFVEQEEQYQRLEQKLKRTIRWRDYSLNGAIGAVTLAVGLVLLECWPEATAGFAIAGVLMSAAVLALNVRIEQIGDEQELLRRSVFERRARYFDLLRHELDARWLDLRSSLNRIWTQDEIPHIYLHDLLSYLEKLKQADEQAFDGANPIREFLTDYRDWRRRLEREAGDAFMKTLNAVEGFIRHEVIVEIPEVNLGVVLALKKHLFKTAALLKKQVGRSEVRVSYQELLQSRKKKLTVAEEGVFFQALHDAVVSESEKQVIRNYLIELYLPSVRHTAVKMGFKGEAFLSAVQDGVIGLLDAINRFDYNSGIHFYSYAGIRVRGNILDENLEDASTPKKTRRRIYRYGLVRLALERQLGREVSAEEWARELGISEIELMNSLSLKYTRSLDEPLRAAGAGSEETMGQQLSYGEADPLLSDVNDFEVLLGRVTILEQLIIKLRYGIGTKNSESYTLENVGRMLGMSSYLVSRNEKEAMEILQEEISLDSKNSVSKDNADVFIVEQMGIKPNDDAFNRLYALKRTQLEQFSAGDIAIRIHEKETIFSIPKIINHPEVLALGPDLVAQRIVALLHGKEIEWRRTQVAHISFQEQAIQDYPEYLQYEPGEALDRQAEIMRFLDIDYSPQIEVRLSETAKFVYLLKQPLKSFSKEEFSEEVWWTLSPLERRAYELVVGETKSLIQAESQLRQEGFLSLTKPAQFGRTKGIGLVVILAKNKLASGKTGMTRLAEVAGAKRENLTEDLLNYLDRRYWRALQLTYGINGPKAQNAKAIVRIMRANGIRKLGARTSVEDAKSIVSTSNRVGLRLLRKNQTGWDYLSRDSGVPVQRLKDPDFKNSIPEEDWRVLQYAYGLGVRRVMHASERLTVLNSLGMTFRNTRHLSDVQAKTIMNMRDLKTGRERIAEKMGVEPSWITDDEFAQLRPKQKLVLGMHYGIGRHRVKQGKALRERLASEGGLDRNGKDYSVAAIGTLKARAFERLRRILLGEDVTAEDLKKMIAASERRRVVEGIPAGVPFTSQDFEQLIIALKPLSDEKSVSDRIRLLRDIWFGLTPFERAVTEINFGLGQAAENHFQKISDAVAKNSLVWDKKTPPSISFISSSRANAILALEQGKTGWKVFSEDSGIPEDFLRTSLDQVLNERENVAFRLKYGLGQPRLRDDVQIQAVMKIKQQQISDARRYGLRKLQKAYVASGAVLRPNPTKREQKFQGGAGWTEAAMREVIAERTDLDLVSKHMIRDGYAGMLKKAASIYGSWDQTLVHFGRDSQKIREAFKQTKKRSEVRAHFGLTEEEVQRLLPTYPTAEAFFGQIDAWEKANPDSKILTLVRHGESMSNLFHYSQSYDSFSPLTSRGQKQAQALAAFFKHMQIRFGQYVASSLERALDTLAPAASQNGSKARKLQRFREILLNPVGEIPMDVLSEIAPDLWSRFTENPELFYLPGGQYSGQKFKEYLYKFIGEDFVKNEGRRTLVASHGMTILLTLMYLLNIPREKYNDFWPKVGTPTHAGITVLAYHPGRENPWEFLVKSDDTHMPEDLRGKTRDKGAVFFERIRFYVLALGRLLQNLLVSPKDVPDDYFSKWRTFFSMNKRQATQSLADYWKRSSGVVGLLDLDWRVDDEARKIDAAQYPEVRVMYESKPGQVQEVGRAPAGPVYGLGREVRQRIRELEKPATDQLAAQLLFSVEHRDGVVTIRKEPKIKRSEVRSSLLDSPADSIDLSLFPDITGQMSYSVFNGVYPRIESMEKTYREWLRSKSFVKDGLLPSLVRQQQQWAQEKTVRVLGIGSGSGLDAMAVLYQLFKEPAIQSIDYYLIDISMKAVENTRYNLVQQLTALGWDFELITKGEGSYEIDLKQKGRILIGRVHEGYEFKELDQLNGGKNAGSFDYVFFNTPVLVRPTQQPGFLAMSSVSSAAASFIFQQMAPKFDTALGMNITTFQNMLSELNRRLEPSGKALLVARVQDHQDIRNTLLPNQLLDIVGQEGNPEPLTDEEALEQRHFFEISTFNPDAGIKTGHSEIKTAHYVDVLRQLNPTDQRKPGELTIDHDHWIEAIRYPALYDLLSKFGGDFSGDVLKVLVLGPGRKRIASSGKARSHSPQMVEILTALSDRKAEYTVVDGDPAVLLAAVNPQWYQITGAEFSHASPHFKLKLRKSLKGITERNFLSRLRRGDNTFRVDPKLISQTKIDSYWGFFENLEYGEEQLDVVIATTSLLYALGSFETVEASLDFTARLIRALKPGGKIFLSKSTLYKGLTLRGNAETGLESNFEKTDLKTWRAQEAIVAQTLGLPKISWNQRIAYELEQRLGFKVDIAETGGIQVLTREPMRSEVRMISSYQLGEAFGTDYVGPTFSGGRNEDFLYEDGKKIAVRLPWAKYVFRALNKDGREIPDRVFKITYYADENEKLFREASNMFSLQQDPAVSGVVRLVRTGMLKNGGMWMEQESIASARSLEREIFGKVARVFEILIRAGEIVKSVHARGLVHADLKPDQFLINDNQDLQLIDFGNAQPMHSALDDRAEHTIGYVPVDEDGQFIMDDLAEDTDAYSFIVMVAKLLDQQTQTDTAGLESTLHRMRDEYMHMIFKEWKFEHFQELWNVGNPLSRITPHPRKKWPRSMEPVLEKLKGDLEIVRTFQQQVTPKSEVRSAAQFVEGRRSLLALPEDRLTPKDVSLILTHTAGASGDAPYDNKQAVLPAVEKLLRSGLFLSNQTFEYVFPGHPSYLEPDLERIVLMQNPNVSREEMYKIPNLSARVFVLTGGGFQQNYVRSSKNLQQGENECQYCAYYAYSNLLQMSAETQGLFSDPFEVHLAADALYSHSSEFYGGGDGWWIESHPTHPEKLQQGFRLGFHPAIEALSLAYRTVAIQDGQMLVLTQNHDQPRLINYLWASTDEMLAHFEKRIERGETDQAVRSEVRKSVAAAEMRHVKKIESFSTPTGVFLDANDLAGVSENHVEAQLDEIMALLSKHKYFDLYVQGDVDLIHNRRFRELLEQYRSRIHFGIMESRASLQQKKILVKASFLESRDTETETRFKLKKLKKDYGVTQDLTPVEYTRAGALKGFLDLAESLTAEEIRDLPARYAVRTASGYLRLTENYLDAVWQDLQNSYVFAWSA